MHSIAATPLLKKTCESCAQSKVKCDGNAPCERCAKRGYECMYVAEQRRGRRMTHSHRPSLVQYSSSSSPGGAAASAGAAAATWSFGAVASSSMGGPPDSSPAVGLIASTSRRLSSASTSTPPPAFLLPQTPVYLRRVVRIIVSLFKFHRAAPLSDDVPATTPVDWFTARLNRLFCLLENNLQWRFLLVVFFVKHRIALDDALASPRAMSAPPAFCNLPRSLVWPLSAQATAKLVFAGTIHSTDGGSTMVCSAEVSQWFGFTSSGSNLPFSALAGVLAPPPPMLPFGAEILCQICEEDSQVLQYVRDAAYALNNNSSRSIRLADRPITIRTRKTRHASLQCFFTAQVDSTAAAVTFSFYLDPADQRINNLALKLPDLELGPWHSDNGDVAFERLLEWAAPLPPPPSAAAVANNGMDVVMASSPPPLS